MIRLFVRLTDVLGKGKDMTLDVDSSEITGFDGGSDYQKRNACYEYVRKVFMIDRIPTALIGTFRVRYCPHEKLNIPA